MRPAPPRPARVLCLGGGYAALGLQRGLRRALARDVELTVVDQNNFLTFHGIVPEMLTGKIQPGQIINASRRIFRRSRFLCARIEVIDVDRRTVTVSRSLDGQQYDLEYDHLVVALGSVDDLSRYSGIAEHAFKLKSYADCFRLRQHIVRMLELADVESDAEERRRLLTFVIAGGNFAGVEVATELDEYFPLVCRREFPHIRPEEIRIVIVHSEPRLLPELDARHPRLVDYVDRLVRGMAGIDVRRRCRVEAATASEVVVTGGERVQARTLISCTGSAPNPLVAQLPFARNHQGRLLADQHLHVVGQSDVWTAGDCAAIPHPDGGLYPPLFLYAQAAGRVIAANILRTLDGRALKVFASRGIGDACALGRRRAAGHLRGIEITGFPAWLIWRACVLYFVPTWDRRLRLLFDWATWPLVGRDIVSLESQENLGLRAAIYEPGQVIIQQRDFGRTMYIIQEGQVEVAVEQDGSERILGVLGPGDHFGEVAVFQHVRRTASVRARTRVRLLELQRDAALSLHRALDSPTPLGEQPVIKAVN